jgi:DNA primase
MEFRDQLKTTIDIVKVVGEYVRLKRLGSTGRYVGLCPFHQEKTPSFNVNQAHQFYKCFGCDAKGDIINFVMEIDGLTFPEALKVLAERNGIPIPKRTEFATAESKLRGLLQDMHATAAQAFQANLKGPQGADARAYLARRGVSVEMTEVFGLGYADPSGQALVRRFSDSGIPAEHMESSGLVRRRQESGGFYDFFRGRLMFPIHDESGKTIAFGGRAMRDDDQPKYLNSTETPIYRKTSVLYNLHRARDGMRKLDRAVLVEGYMDVIGAYAAGVKEVVASCGTALTSLQVRSIHRHADTIVVNFDPDTAGSNAAEKALQLLLDEGLHVRVLTLDGGLDPDEYVKQHGAEVYRAKLDSASGYFHWLADRARAKFDMRSADGRLDVFKFLLPAVQKIGDKLARAAVANDIASYLGVEPSLVLEQFKKAATERKAPAARSQAAHLQARAIPSNERILLGSLLGSDRARAEVLPKITAPMTEGFLTLEIFDALRDALAQSGDISGPAAFTAVEGRLSSTAQALLHQVIAADDMGDEASCWEQAQACLRQLESSLKRRQVDELRARVKTAEREGRMNEAIEWMTQLHRLERAK